MASIHHLVPLLTLLGGAIVVVAILLKESARRVGISSISVFLLFGIGLRLVVWGGGWELPIAEELLVILSTVGVFALLFRVGLKSDLDSLADYLVRATPIWAGNVLVSGLLGYAAARWALGYALIPSLFCGVALTASSVGVAVAAWQEADVLDSPGGTLLVDVAELDDISGIVAMGLMLAVAVPLHEGQTDQVTGILLHATGIFALKLVAFAAACYLFSQWLEQPLTDWLTSFEHEPDPMLSVVGLGLVIAAVAGLIGFSVAIGAFFAGLTFSRDPEAVEMDAAFSSLYDVFTPFFFIHLGFSVSPEHLGSAGSAAIVLLVAAVVGKLLGTFLGSIPTADASTAWRVGLSLVPRAEIALVILAEGQLLGAWAVPEALFSGMVIVSMVTCTVVPLALRKSLRDLSPDTDGHAPTT